MDENYKELLERLKTIMQEGKITIPNHPGLISELKAVKTLPDGSPDVRTIGPYVRSLLLALKATQ